MQARDTRVTVQLLPDEVVRRWWWHRHSPGPPTIHAMGAWGLVYWVPADSERMNWRFLFLGSDSPRQAFTDGQTAASMHALECWRVTPTPMDTEAAPCTPDHGRLGPQRRPPRARQRDRHRHAGRVTWIARRVHGGSGSACACRAQHLALAFSLFACHARLLVRACFLTRTV
jgi:hypothetical protein